MSVGVDDVQWFAGTFGKIAENMSRAVLGKENVVRLAVTCLLTEGHLLLEDAPGTGKTALARSLAATVQGSQKRIQFTPDLLPSDVTGATVFDQRTNTWSFRQGPVFASIVLADEINRASPKTQSALLEVMEEHHVTVDGEQHDVDRPFMVIATQNPIEHAGTYRLPEAQLDRFLMKTSIGYPNRADALRVLAGSAEPDRARALKPVIASGAVAQMIDMVADNHVDEAVLDYVQRITEATRDDRDTVVGVSTRGSIAMVRAARVWAAAHGRDHVLPDDVKRLAQPVWAHRIVLTPEAQFAGQSSATVVRRAVDAVEAPMLRGAR